MPDPESLIPFHHTGVEKEVHHRIIADTTEEAAAAFSRARNRLLAVTEWACTADGSSAKFLLCDNTGEAVSRQAQQEDLVRIDLPGPHRTSDSGYDWVVLEHVEEGTDGEGNPWIVLTTRPVADPTSPKDNPAIAHFFDEGSTGTFVIKQNGLIVEGSHYGRNELPNTEGAILDKARAVVVTAGAYLGLSDVQWSNLVKGLLS